MSTIRICHTTTYRYAGPVAFADHRLMFRPRDSETDAETDAWTQIYLPGAGWVEFDPTNGIVGGSSLIRVAVTRDPAQAIPLAGSFTGAPADFQGMHVEVDITQAD